MFQASAARATHPDYEGERGLELQLSGGVGGALTHDESVFLPSEELPRPEVRPPTDSFGANFGFDLSAGYRFTPYLSAGLSGGYQSLVAANQFSPSEADFRPHDAISSFHVGAYARVYPMAFFNGSRQNPRVFFDTWTDRRRFEPWLSLGVSVAQYGRFRNYEDVRVRDSYTRWTTTYLGIPVGLGVDYRIIPSLAVGLNATFTALVGGGTTHEVYRHVVLPGSDTTTTSERSYAPGGDSNTAFSVGISVRYTFTFGSAAHSQ